jgi:hypothetical protein
MPRCDLGRLRVAEEVARTGTFAAAAEALSYKLLGGAEDLPFPTDHFDRYVSCGSIEYWPDPHGPRPVAHASSTTAKRPVRAERASNSRFWTRLRLATGEKVAKRQRSTPASGVSRRKSASLGG